MKGGRRVRRNGEREKAGQGEGVRESLGEEWREKRLIYRRREEGRRGTKGGWGAGTDGWMELKVCERGRGEETRVKVVIDGRPGLRPLPHIGQGACFCQPSFHPFLSSSFSPFLPLNVIPLVVLCLFHFMYSLSLSAPLSPSFWHPPPSFQLLNHKLDHMKTSSLLRQTLESHKHILLTIRTSSVTTCSWCSPGSDISFIIYLMWKVYHLQKLRTNALSHLPATFLTCTYTHTVSKEGAVVAFAFSQSQLIWHKQNLCLISCLVTSMFVWPQMCTHTSVSACAVGTSVSLSVQSSDHILRLDTETTWPFVDEQDPHIHIINDRPILASAFKHIHIFSSTE